MTDTASEGELVLGRYRLDQGAPLGNGGWCIVYRAQDTKMGNRPVAVKTFGPQAIRDLSEQALAARFKREVATFQAIGVALVKSDSSGSTAPPPHGKGREHRQLFVNLLDYSTQKGEGGDEAPGPAADGKFYTVLELADSSLDCSLDHWLETRAKGGKFVELEELREIARLLAFSLAQLHAVGLCHLDVKPENILAFGGRWKLIDLESCLPRDAAVSSSNFTPLYASPELAKLALSKLSSKGSPLAPAPTMDSWAAGVVLLDVLAHTAAMQDTKAGFDQSALFDGEDIPHESWYRWLADDSPINPSELVAYTPGQENARKLLTECSDLREVLAKLLEKDPARRLTAAELCRHPFVAHVPEDTQPKESAHSQRKEVEMVFQKWLRGAKAVLGRKVFMALLVRVGLDEKDAQKLLEACGAAGQNEICLRDFLDFVYA